MIGTRLRVRPQFSCVTSEPCNSPQYESDHGEDEEGGVSAGEVLEVLGQSSAPSKPSKCPLDDPALG